MGNRLAKWTLVLALSFGGVYQSLSAMEVTPPAGKEMSWMEYTVPSNDVTLEDIASTYYGDVKKASLIYEVNKEIIPKSKRLHKGMILMLPITEDFRDQPEPIGWR